MNKVIKCDEVTYEALRTVGLYSDFIRDALFLKAQVIFSGSMLN